MSYKTIKRVDWVKIEKVSFENYAMLAMQSIEPDIQMLCRLNQISGYDVDDLAQELRLRLWTKIGKYNPKKAGFRTWAIKVMKNYLINLYRKVNKKNQDLLNYPHTFSLENIYDTKK